MRSYYGDALIEILKAARRPAMPTAPFALLDSHPASDKPRTFRTVDALAARIHQLRQDAALNLADFDLTFAGENAPRRTVAVYTQDESGSRTGFIGYAWVNGRSWRALQAALYAQHPNTIERAEAA